MHEPLPQNLDPLVSQKLAEVRQHCRQRRVRRLAVFGSVLTSSFNETSDVDLLVEFDRMPPVEHADCYFGLIEDLETLFGRPVDLVEREAVRNPYLQRAIDASQEVLFDAA